MHHLATVKVIMVGGHFFFILSIIVVIISNTCNSSVSVWSLLQTELTSILHLQCSQRLKQHLGPLQSHSPAERERSEENIFTASSMTTSVCVTCSALVSGRAKTQKPESQLGEILLLSERGDLCQDLCRCSDLRSVMHIIVF